MATKSIEAQMKDLLDTFDRDVQNAVEDAADEASKECVRKLKSSSPKGSSGKYARSWTRKKLAKGYVVYNKEYQLTHLLENGHAVSNQYGDYGHPGGRVAARVHIAPVEQEGIKDFELRINRGINE